MPAARAWLRGSCLTPSEPGSGGHKEKRPLALGRCGVQVPGTDRAESTGVVVLCPILHPFVTWELTFKLELVVLSLQPVVANEPFRALTPGWFSFFFLS